MTFTLNERLAADTAFVTDWALSRVLAMNDARFPWLILVPRRVNLSELHDLNHGESLVLMEEIRRSGEKLKAFSGADKINTGALGNMVPQLHVHIIARKAGDAAWPGAVWNHGTPQPYAPDELETFVASLRAAL
ncbi:MAG TPA: HIT family protein [Rhizomicrobium sp.]|nr:HIT family protein [Rhizomicrobium sp.]